MSNQADWTFEDNVRVAVCPKCAFAFDATHKSKVGYVCPVCEERNDFKRKSIGC